jgi:hypothetical protein
MYATAIISFLCTTHSNNKLLIQIKSTEENEVNFICKDFEKKAATVSVEPQVNNAFFFAKVGLYGTAVFHSSFFHRVGENTDSTNQCP